MALVRTGRLITRPHYTDLPGKKRGGSGGGSTRKKMAKAGLRPQTKAESDTGADDEDSNARLMRQMKERGVDGSNYRIRERDNS